MAESEEELFNRWDQRKSELMESMLGKEHDMVMHSIISYHVGGGLDRYYYPHGVPGTTIATKELSELPDQGSPSDAYSCYELVMFTRHALDLDAKEDGSSPFGTAHARMSAILNVIAPYSADATVNPLETCEFPADMEGIGGACLIFDGYASRSDDMVQNFGLLNLIEVFRSEMEYARKEGSAKLIRLLKAAGHYPYSDLDRDPVA